jgi:hypothetical protein
LQIFLELVGGVFAGFLRKMAIVCGFLWSVRGEKCGKAGWWTTALTGWEFRHGSPLGSDRPIYHPFERLASGLE